MPGPLGPARLPTARKTRSKQTVLLLTDQSCASCVRMPHPMAGPFSTSNHRPQDCVPSGGNLRARRQLPPEGSKPWYVAARLKKPAYSMNDAPRKRRNRLGAAVKNMGLRPTRADRRTYVSYSDVKKHKETHMAHSIDACEDTPSIGLHISSS